MQMTPVNANKFRRSPGVLINDSTVEPKFSVVRVIASLILHEICLLIGEFAIRGT